MCHEGDEEFGARMSEWREWFGQNSAKLVQRGDYRGWILIETPQAEESSAPGIMIVFPEFLLPKSPFVAKEDAQVVPPSLRRVMSW